LNLFIDIDGVLLGKNETSDEVVLANHAAEFLEYSLKHFSCYWLTTHCKGSVETVIDYLTPYADAKFIELIKCIKPTNFRTFKTEALFGDFIWVDDQPTAYEIQYLDEQGLLDRWLQINTRKDINELRSLPQYLDRFI